MVDSVGFLIKEGLMNELDSVIFIFVFYSVSFYRIDTILCTFGENGHEHKNCGF